MRTREFSKTLKNAACIFQNRKMNNPENMVFCHFIFIPGIVLEK